MTKRARALLAVFALLAVVFAIEAAFHPRFRRQKTIYDFSNEEIASRLVEIYNFAGVFRTTRWMGIETQQAPTDLWSVQEIIWETRPDFIIETGTLHGGSALYFASLLDHINPEGKVITVDIADQTQAARKNPLFQKYVIALSGSSLDEKVLAEISRLVEGKRALVFLDSDHHMAHVLKEMYAYAGFVSLGNYMIVNDTWFKIQLNEPGFGPGPMEAVKAFMKTNKSFEIDPFRTRLLLTFHPGGYLRRIT